MSAAYDSAWTRLYDGELLLLDGGVSTELERRGISMQPQLWSGRAALDAWDGVVDMHRAYIDAGAQVITANTYAASRLLLEPAGLGDQVADINRRAIAAAQQARERAGTPEVLVAGSLSHMVPIPAGGYRVDPDARPDYATMTAAFRESAAVHTDAGADLLLLEMMSAPGAMAAMFDALVDAELPVWCGLSATFGDDGGLRSWHEPAVAFEQIVADAAHQGFDVLGVMHTRVDLIESALAAVRAAHAGPTMAYPDSGHLAMPNWDFSDTIAPDDFADYARSWRAAGTAVIGGCCGLGPEHIAALAALG